MTDRFAELIEAKVEASAGVGGWANGPRFICEQAVEETVDIPSWLRGLDQFPMTPEQQGMLDIIVGDAALLFDAIERLKATYGES